jgi:hypothetical protein
MATKGFCEGRFKDDVIAVLKADPGGNAYLGQECAVCGQKVRAEIKAGFWGPVSHRAPGKKLVNPSGKSGYYKH